MPDRWKYGLGSWSCVGELDVVKVIQVDLVYSVTDMQLNDTP